MVELLEALPVNYYCHHVVQQVLSFVRKDGGNEVVLKFFFGKIDYRGYSVNCYYVGLDKVLKLLDCLVVLLAEGHL